MITTQDIKQFARTAFVLSRGGAAPHSLLHPTTHWWTGLVVAAIVLCVAGWWSVATYLQYQDGPDIAIEQAGEAPVLYRAQLVESVIAAMTEREAARAALLAEGALPAAQPEAPTAPGDVPVAASAAPTAPTETDPALSETPDTIPDNGAASATPDVEPEPSSSDIMLLPE